MKSSFKSFLLDFSVFLRGLNQRSVIALMATVISVCAFCVSVYQTQLARRQQLASVWPYLSIGGYGTANSTSQSWGLRVVNNGLGPAIIESVKIGFAGQAQPFKKIVDSLYIKTTRMDSLKTLNYSINEIERGNVISAGSTVEWLSFDLQFSSTPPGEPASKRFLPNLQLVIQYKSLYGERWESCFNCSDGTESVRKIE